MSSVDTTKLCNILIFGNFSLLIALETSQLRNISPASGNYGLGEWGLENVEWQAPNTRDLR